MAEHNKNVQTAAVCVCVWGGLGTRLQDVCVVLTVAISGDFLWHRYQKLIYITGMCRKIGVLKVRVGPQAQSCRGKKCGDTEAHAVCTTMRKSKNMKESTCMDACTRRLLLPNTNRNHTEKD